MASTTEDKLRLAISSKEDIRQAIEDKGVKCSTDVPFSRYGDKIRSIKTGGVSLAHGEVRPGNVSFGRAINIEAIGGFVKQS